MMIPLLLFLGGLTCKTYALQVDVPFVPLACLDTFIRFSGGTPSYTLKILAADTRKVLDSFVVTNSPYLWSIPNAADRLLLFSITDALGVIAESDVFIVQRDSHFDCEDTFPGNDPCQSDDRRPEFHLNRRGFLRDAATPPILNNAYSEFHTTICLKHSGSTPRSA
ncbi:hypothetical protein FRC14_002626 [Serendipita sp. 396]|nr:hypothetical protein FRC14_002626 [Serendipita sp. 396]